MAAHNRGSNPSFTLRREESTNDNDDASDCMDTKPQAVDSKIHGATQDTLHPPLETSTIHGSTVSATVEDTLSTQFRTVTTLVEARARPAQTTTTITSNKDQHSSTRMVSRPMLFTQERTSSLSIRQESVSFATISQPQNDQKPAASMIMSREQLQTQTCSSSSVASRQPEATVAASATPKSKRAKRRTPAADSSASYSTGRWTDAEHEAFLRGLQLYGREWKKVAAHIPTRTSAQVRSHAQKHFVKLQRDEDALGVVSSSSNARSSQTQTLEGLARGLSPAAQSTLARIMAHPELVEQEVEVTMQRLAQRYRQLQDRLRHMEREEAQAARLAMARKRPAEQPQQPQQMIGRTNDDRDERTLGLEDEELIAVSVLHAALPRSADGMSHGGGGSNEASLASELETMDTCNSSTNTTHDGGDENTTTSNESLSSNKRSKVMDFSSS